MKSSLALSWCAAIAAVALAPAAIAQTMVSTGVVLSTSAEKATVTIRSDQTRRQLIIPGMRGARVMYSSGKPALFGDVQSGMPVTISYAVRDGRWVVGALYVPDPPPPGASSLDRLWLLTPGQRGAPNSRALQDHDITTQPGVRALIGNDITLRPGRRALFGDDRTLKAPRSAAYDHDITTQAGN
ncbi:MAG: hypothetical protein QOE70_4607 [Chthoniobacter sp.]|jgi:hypothetical protein|nr:hypothetical protein [Chthoniobacter sp.]